MAVNTTTEALCTRGDSDGWISDDAHRDLARLEAFIAEVREQLAVGRRDPALVRAYERARVDRLLLRDILRDA